MGIRESKIDKNCQGLPLNGYVRVVQVSDGVLAEEMQILSLRRPKRKIRDPDVDGVLAEERSGSGRTNTRSEKKGVKKLRIREIVSKSDET